MISPISIKTKIALGFAAVALVAVSDASAGLVHNGSTVIGNGGGEAQMGIGTGPSTSQLYLRGTKGRFQMDKTTAGDVQIVLRPDSGAVDQWSVIVDDSDGNRFKFINGVLNNAPAMSLDGAKLGIGKNPVEVLDVEGGAFIKDTLSAAVVEIRGAGNDLAESFKVNNPMSQIKPGMVVSIDPQNPGEMALASSPYDRKVAGIINGAGGLHAGIHLGDIQKEGNGFHQVALTGRVYVKADASNGAIEPGDMLTTSMIPGHAMKVTDYTKAQGAVIGKAMTPINPETGLVLVLVSLQ